MYPDSKLLLLKLIEAGWRIYGITASDNVLPPVITWTNADLLCVRPLGTNFLDILIKNQIFSLKKNTFENNVR